MPELWLPYGSVEVPVDLKAENLGSLFEPKSEFLSDAILAEHLRELATIDGATVMVSDGGKAVEKVLTIFSRLLEERNPPVPVKVYCSRESLPLVRKNCSPKVTRVSVIPERDTDIDISDTVVKVPKFLIEESNLIQLCVCGFDPLFGFSGGAGSLLRLVAPQALIKVLESGEHKTPSPAIEGPASSFATQFASRFKVNRNFEIVEISDQIAAIQAGDLVTSHDQAKSRVLEIGRKTIDYPANAVLVSPGGDFQSSTLSSSLKSLWNVVGALSERGQVVLIAECSEGLGSEALEHYVSGRLDPLEKIKRRQYLPGLEDIIYLKEILSRNTIILVSSLPRYFSELKLGFRTVNRVNDAISEVMKTLGGRTKFHVFPRGTESLLHVGGA